MYRMQNGQLAMVTGGVALFTLVFQLVSLSTKLFMIAGAFAFFWTSHGAIVDTFNRWKETLLALKSSLFDDKVDLAELLRKLNPKAAVLKEFRASFKTTFKMPLSR
jgi:hypothetical protein